MGDWPSTATSVLMVHSSTRTTSSVTGGSTLTALLPRISTLLMMKLLLNVKLLQELLLMLQGNTELLSKRNMKLLLLMKQKADQQEGWEERGTTGEGEGGEEIEVNTTQQMNKSAILMEWMFQVNVICEKV